MNIRKMENLAKFIEKLPRTKFNIEHWAELAENCKEDKITLKNMNLCGTTCCIAGWQAVRMGFQIEEGGMAYKGTQRHP